MGKKRKELSHTEIWDDSALLQSWDDALAEYKLYHSIHARGERVEDVFKDLEDKVGPSAIDGVSSATKDTDTATDGVLADGMEDGELGEEAASAGAVDNGESIETSQKPPTSTYLDPHSHPERDASEQQQQATRGMPNAIINGVQNEALKNLMMSWYYAGYYTGLYEGQQKAQNSKSV